MRVAAIDIGTVTCRLYVADVEPSGVKPVTRQSGIVNLGEGVDATGRLKQEAMDRTVALVAQYKRTMDELSAEKPIEAVVCLATSASRDAENSHEFVSRLAELGISVSVIPGSKEAELSFRGASNEFRGEDLLFCDIGGGSTELVYGRADGEEQDLVAGLTMRKAHSFNVGVRRLTERFFANNPPSAEEISQARAWVKEMLAPFLTEGIPAKRLIAVAGTPTSVVAIREEMAVYDSARVHGTFVSTKELREVTERMFAMPTEERMKVVGLQPQRAAILPAGLLILETIIELAGLDGFTASESDILMGIVLDAVNARSETDAQSG